MLDNFTPEQLAELGNVANVPRFGWRQRDAMVAQTVRMARENGFVDLARLCLRRCLKPAIGIRQLHGKAICCFVIGKTAERGMNIVGAHIDSPRMDLKPNPLYEDSDLAYLDTHYYGGIKKYQWVALPLALHGVVAKKDGSVVTVVIGEDDNDPVVGVSDLLIHLSADQLGKKGAVVIEGEQLDVIVGGKPVPTDEEGKNSVKDGILTILKEKYGIEEEDFLSAEIEVVPAGKARDFGLDRSMILGYGQDDRVCAFPALEALFAMRSPEKTCCCILSDKEEIGSVGATGMEAHYFENAVAEILNCLGAYSELALRRVLASSRMLSCDVDAGFDPNFAGVFEKKNAAYLGRGVCFCKYTGSRGKSGSNDANAEYIARLRAMLDQRRSAISFPSLAKWIRAAAAQSLISARCTAWKSSTAASRY
jgi:aspartyl aminopeptidase